MRKFPFFLLLWTLLNNANAQNVGIGTTTPNSSAILDLSSTSKGFLLPRMSTAQRNAIVNPENGLQIYNTDDGCIDILSGGNWLKNCPLKQAGTAVMSDNVWKQKKDVSANYGFFLYSTFTIAGKEYGMDYFAKVFEYDPVADTWTEKAVCPGGAREYPVAFAIGSKGYFGTGWVGGIYKQDFWEYDPGSNTWIQRANFGGPGRENAVGFSIGSKGYIGTGYTGSTYLNDFWEFDPIANSWTQKTSFGGVARTNSVGFSIGTKGYIGTGYDLSSTAKNDFWEYDQGANSWTQKADASVQARYRATGFSIGSKGYIGTGSSGYAFLNDFWEYTPATDSWVQKPNVGGTQRYRTLGFSIGTYGYIICGDAYGVNYRDVWEYNTTPTTVPAYSSAVAPVAAVISDGSWTRNGTQLYNSTNGNVGIGTQAPTTKLHVAGSLKIEDGTQGANKVLTSDAAGIASWQNLPAGAATWGLSGNNIYNSNAGNVGIGTNSPGFPLNFANSSGDKISLWGNSGAHYGLGIQSALLQIHTDVAGSNIAFGYGTSGLFTERARIVNSGEYGLVVKGRLQLNPGTQSAGLWLANAANTNNVSFIGLASDNQVGFYSPLGAGWGVTMNGVNGNLGIGLNGGNPLRPLSFPAALGEKILLYPGGTGEVGIGVYGNELRLHADNPGASVSFGTQDNAGNFTQAGRFQINAPYALYVNGSIWANGTTYASDERFKENITPIASPLEKLMQINAVEYEMKTKEFSNNHFTTGRQIGLLAQNVEKIVPEAVSEKDGYKGVDYARLVPLLIESIKALQKEIEALKAKK